MKKFLLLFVLALGLGSKIAVAADTTPIVINDSTKVYISGATAETLSGQVVLQTGNATSVTYNITTGAFTDSSGKPAVLTDDQRRALTADAKAALTQAAQQAKAGSYGESSPAVLAALVKTLIALDPVNASTYTNTALNALVGPSTGITDKKGAVALITDSAKDAIADASLSTTEKKALVLQINQTSQKVLEIVTVLPTPAGEGGEIIQPVDINTISNGSGNGNANGNG